MLLVFVYLILLFPLIVVSFSPPVFLFRCVLHPLPLPLSPCLGCIPPLIGLPSLRFYSVESSLFLLSVCFCLCFLFYRDDVLYWLLSYPFSSVCFPCLSPIPGLIWFGSVYLVTTAGFEADQLMRDKQQQQQRYQYVLRLMFMKSHVDLDPFLADLAMLGEDVFEEQTTSSSLRCVTN